LEIVGCDQPIRATATVLHSKSGPNPGDSFLVGLRAQLKARFGIGHSMIQVETDPHTARPLGPDQVV
jgi:hypothetical protein